MNTSHRIMKGTVTVLAVACVVLLLGASVSAKGTVVWLHNFDSDLSEDWWISHGEMEISNGELATSDCVEVSTYDMCLAIAWLNSTSVVGSWMFDMYVNDSTTNSLGLYFASKGQTGLLDGVESFAERGYCLFIFGNQTNENFGEAELQFGARTSPTSGCPGASLDNFSLEPGWHRFHINREENGYMELFIDEEPIINTTQSIPNFSAGEHFYFSMNLYNRIDNLMHTIPEEPTGSPNPQSGISTTDALLAGSGILGLTVAGYASGRYIKKKRITRHTRISRKIFSEVSRDFELSNKSLWLLLGVTDPKKHFAKYATETNAQQDLLKYRYLMHPIRLTILKNLHLEEPQVSASIRERLDITWGEYHTHLKSLQENGYVELNSTFDEHAKVVKTVIRTFRGRQEFDTLFTLLQEFVQKNSPLDQLVNKDQYDKDLYPGLFE